MFLNVFDSDLSQRPTPQENVASKHPEPDTIINPRLSSYRDYLRSRYKVLVHTSSIQWPPVPTTKVIKLAMIKKETIQRGRIDDEFVRMSITGKVDDILHSKTPVDLENIFSDSEDGRKVILIEGAPGSGKSTLSLHICQEWGKGKLFQQYDVVIFVRLRDPHVQKAKTIADLLPQVSKSMADHVEADIIYNYGKGVLWVLDGWDELSADFAPDSVIHKLIQPGMFHDSPVHECDVIVTSRPVSSAKLHPLVSARVEVLGFTPDELKHYFTECLKGDSKAVQSLLERIRENPVLEGSCYLPLNAAIVAHVYLAGDRYLPTSNHEIFTSVVRFSLSRYMQDRLGKLPHEAMVTSLETLPSDLQNVFDQLCRLAYFGVFNDKVTFVPYDLKSAHILIKVSEVGLLQAVPSILVDSQEVYYCFLHLSIHELLAAVHISHMPSGEQISVFQELFGQPHFSAVFQFYAGITKLKTYRWFLSKLPSFVFPNSPRGILDLVTGIIKRQSNPLLVSLIHCLYEAEDPSLCQFVAEQLNGVLSLSYTTLSPFGCLSMGYFISTITCGTFRVRLNECSIGDQGFKFLTRGLCKSLNTPSTVITQIDMDLRSNDIHEEGAHHIVEILTNTNVLHKLNLKGNHVGNEGLKSLCEVMLSNTSLTELNLANCSIVVSEDNGPVLTEMLRRNNTLKVLDLSGNSVTESGCHYIATGLKDNASLRELHLFNCGLANRGVEGLSTGLNDYIEELYLDCNSGISISGLRILVSHLITPARLRLVLIPIHLESSINSVFGPVNEVRMRNGLPKIDVWGEWLCLRVLCILITISLIAICRTIILPRLLL